MKSTQMLPLLELLLVLLSFYSSFTRGSSRSSSSRSSSICVNFILILLYLFQFCFIFVFYFGKLDFAQEFSSNSSSNGICQCHHIQYSPDCNLRRMLRRMLSQLRMLLEWELKMKAGEPARGREASSRRCLHPLRFRFRFRLSSLNIRNWLNIRLNIRLNVQSLLFEQTWRCL